jgi:hypothetical protein
MTSAIRVIIYVMLSDELIREIGANHKNLCLCVTRICSHVGKQDDELTAARARIAELEADKAARQTIADDCQTMRAAYQNEHSRRLQLQEALTREREHGDRLKEALYGIYTYEAQRSDADTAWERPMMTMCRTALAAHAAMRAEGRKGT